MDKIFWKNSPYIYQSKLSLEERQKEVQNFKAIHPNKVPLIVQLHHKSNLKTFLGLQMQKMLVIESHKVISLLASIRNNFKLNKADSIYLFVNYNEILKNDDTEIKKIYEKYKDVDGYLYITIAEIATFG